MYNSRQFKCIPMRVFSDIDEPIVWNNNVAFVQNLSSGSKILIFNLESGKMKSIVLKNALLFNIHADNKCLMFEFSGNKRGIGIISADTMELTEVDCISSNIILGGIWNGNIVYRRGNEIVLFDMEKGQERVIASCHHIWGAPVISHGICAWQQVYRDKCCVICYDIEKGKNIVLSSSGYINKLFIIDEYIVYQNCCNNKCSIYTYNTSTGDMKNIFSSFNWVELYRGGDGLLVWTVRKECQLEYSFDIWIYNINNERIIKAITDCKSVVIPAASKETVAWVGGGSKGDNLNILPVKF